jgi:2-dehydro-3-deoxyphosphooctonate aldolase (KDO 8-P synthase)
MKIVQIGSDKVDQVTIGDHRQLTLMAGPCVIESLDICFRVAERLKSLCEKLGIGYVFKASFDKANRTSVESFRGPGLDEGLKVLEQVQKEFSLPILSDVHTPEQATIAGEVLDVIQIPAFLARQTDLIEAVAKTQKCVQIKKAQFMAPWDLKNVIEKVTHHGNEQIILVERGVSFGYNRLVCDMIAIPEMKQLGYPTIIDATHATQKPSGLGGSSGGSAEEGKILARAALAAGADGLFLETHPNPAKALSDATSMIPLDQLKNLLILCRDIFQCVRTAKT